MMAKDGQFIHLSGLAELLLPSVLESPALLEADEHEMVPVGEDQGLPRSGNLGGGGSQAFITFDLPTAQYHQVALTGVPKLQVEELSGGRSARFEERGALDSQGIEKVPGVTLSLECMGQGTLCFALQGLSQLAQGLEPEAEPGRHQTLLRNGARSMPKIWPMASMAWRWSEPSAIAWRRKDWMAGWNWIAWSMVVLEPLV